MPLVYLTAADLAAWREHDRDARRCDGFARGRDAAGRVDSAADAREIARRLRVKRDAIGTPGLPPERGEPTS